MKNFIRSCLFMLACVLHSVVHAQTPPQSAPTEFWIAVEADWAGDVKKFLNKGVSPNAVHPQGNPALLLAIQENAWKVYDLLIAQKTIDLNVENPVHDNALMYLTISQDVPRIKALIAKGAEINKEGWTPLHYAAVRGNLELVTLFVENHAYLDAENPKGNTPLMIAAQEGHVDIVRFLLNEGADPTVKNAAGKTAVMLAAQAGHSDLANAMSKRINQARAQGSRSQPWIE